MTRVRLVQLMDANDVHADGTLDFTAPFDRPYDRTVSGDPALLARLLDFFTTNAGLREVRTYADGVGPWKRYIVSTAAVDLDGDGVVSDENGDGVVNEAERRRLAAGDAGNPISEYLQFYALGIDGVFSDFPDTAVAARFLFELSGDRDAADCLVDRRECR